MYKKIFPIFFSYFKKFEIIEEHLKLRCNYICNYLCIIFDKNRNNVLKDKQNKYIIGSILDDCSIAKERCLPLLVTMRIIFFSWKMSSLNFVHFRNMSFISLLKPRTSCLLTSVLSYASLKIIFSSNSINSHLWYELFIHSPI